VNTELTTKIHRGEAAFSELEQDWNALLGTCSTDFIFMTWEWQKTWWEWFGGDSELSLVTVHEDSEQLALAPFYSTATGPDQRKLRLVGGVEISDYLDLLVADDSRQQAAYEALWNLLIGQDGPQWDILDLHNVPASSPSLGILPVLARGEGGFEVASMVEEVSPAIFLPSTWDEYLSSLSRKQRHEIRRKVRKVNREAMVRWYYTEDATTLHEDVDDFIRLHQLSAEPKRAFMDNRMQGFFHAIAETALEKGWLRLAFLVVNEVKAATMLCFEYGNSFQVYNSGYDPDMRPDLSTGIVLLSYCINDSIERGMEVFDFLRGDEEYKYRFGAESRDIFNLRISRRGSMNV
jgi:CelD/BcsL family acetyltransferase involved in cellulose biosynthesis